MDSSIKEITEVNEINTLLSANEESEMYVDMYSSSFKRIFIGVFNPKSKRRLFLVGLDCKYMNGCFHSENVVLIVSRIENTSVMVLRDKNNRFELQAQYIFLLNTEDEFYTKEFKRKFMFLND